MYSVDTWLNSISLPLNPIKTETVSPTIKINHYLIISQQPRIYLQKHSRNIDLQFDINTFHKPKQYTFTLQPSINYQLLFIKLFTIIHQITLLLDQATLFFYKLYIYTTLIHTADTVSN